MSLIESGRAQIDRELAALPAGKRVAVITIVDVHGVRIGGTAALDAHGTWQVSAELEKRRQEQGVRWRAAVAWSW